MNGCLVILEKDKQTKKYELRTPLDINKNNLMKRRPIQLPHNTL